MTPADEAITLDEIDKASEQLKKQLRFPAAAEAQFQQSMRLYFERNITKLLWPTVFLYNGFLIADLLLLPSTLLVAALSHLGVTGIIILLIWLYPRIERQSVREAAVSAIPMLMVAQIMYVYALNANVPAADHYQYLATMVVVYMNINLRSGFNLAIKSTVLLSGIYLVVLLVSASAVDAKFVGACLMGSAAYLSLMANRRMERDVRYDFLRRLSEQIRRQNAETKSQMDALTKLPNRRRMNEVVKSIWESEAADGLSVAVIMIDIDHFKKFNDRYGHLQGDICLKRIAGAITAELRGEQDLAVRMGGEEFLMLMPDLDLPGAVRVAERLRRRIEEMAIPNEDAPSKRIVTASIGVISGPTSEHCFKELTSSADAALYAAKKNGRNQVWPPLVRGTGQVVSFPNGNEHDGLKNEASSG